MKKHLLATTALVAAGMFAMADSALAQAKVEPVRVSVGGYYAAQIGILDQDKIGGFSPETVDVQDDAEIHFNGRTTLDNGMTVGFRIELEGITDTGDQIDESYVFTEGAFGRVEIGSLNNVHYRMAYKAPDVYTRGWFNEGNQNDFVRNITVAGGSDTTINTTVPRLADNDAEKVNYYTPRIAGFQIGASYVPDQRQDDRSIALEGDNLGQGYAVGGNFVRNFGTFDVAASAGYFAWGDAPAGVDEPSVWSVGLQVGFGGFRVGGSYGSISDIGGSFGPAPGTAFTADGTAYDVGASYTFGPAAVSLTYFNGTVEVDTATSSGDETNSGIAVAGKYTLGPGVSLEAVGSWQEIESEILDQKNEAFGVVGALVLVF